VLKTATLPQENAAPVLRVADGGVGADSDLVQAGIPDTEMVAAILRNCVREKQNAMRQHGRNALLSAGRHGLIMLALFGAVHAMSGFTMPYVFAVVPVSFLLDFVTEWFGCPLWSTPLQRQTALSLNAIAPDDPRTLVVLFDALPQIPTRPLFPYHFRRSDYDTLFPALAAALWNAGDDLPLVLTDTRRARLRGTLHALWRGDGDLSTGEADFCAAAIKALALLGDPKTERILKRIAAGDALGVNRAFVRSLAVGALPILRERAAENAAHTKAFRALLHAKNKAVDLHALESFAQSLGEAQMQAVAQQYLQSNNRSHGLLFGAMLSLFVAALIPLLTFPFLPGANKYLLLLSCLPIFFVCLLDKRFQVSEVADENEKARMRLVIDHATRTSSPVVLPDLLDTMAQQKWRRMQSGKIIAAMANLQPSDSVFLEARYLRFLRGAVRERCRWAQFSTWSNDFVTAAIHALGIAGDVTAKRDLERLLSDTRPENAPLRYAASVALARINAVGLGGG